MIKLKDMIPGGIADGMSIDAIAKKHGVSRDVIIDQLKLGVRVEMEHTNDKKVALEIAMDHLWEMKDYYTRLKDMEANSESD